LVFWWIYEPYSLEGNIAGPIDVKLVGINIVYRGFGIPFDPEGVLGVLSGSVTILLDILLEELFVIQMKRLKLSVSCIQSAFYALVWELF
jgi:predicted acyltransferase